MIILDMQGLPHRAFHLLALRHPTQRPEVSVDVFVKRQRFWTSIYPQRWSLKSLCQFVGNKWWHCQTPLLATNINIGNIGKPCKYLNIVYHKVVWKQAPKPVFSDIEILCSKKIFSPCPDMCWLMSTPPAFLAIRFPSFKILLNTKKRNRQNFCQKETFDPKLHWLQLWMVF